MAIRLTVRNLFSRARRTCAYSTGVKNGAHSLVYIWLVPMGFHRTLHTSSKEADSDLGRRWYSSNAVGGRVYKGRYVPGEES